jgi:formimidoylglutamase
MSEDALWPRASTWLTSGVAATDLDLAVLGVPAHLTSISPTNAHQTPGAVRAALQRYSTWSASNDLDVAQLSIHDFGDVVEPDSPQGEQRTSALVAEATAAANLSLIIGGDNSVTYAAMRGACQDLSRAGLITLDAHHDLRDGVSNGSPVRRLVEAGLPGHQIAQLGIADFSNSPAYAALAKELGIHVVPRSRLRATDPAQIWAEAVAALGDVDTIYVDIDVDVCDRAEVPGCPAAAPGGITADELRQFAYLAGRTAKVRAIDFTEVDAAADVADQRTVRLVALLMLEASGGLASRSVRN